jgi:hypothetical protein
VSSPPAGLQWLFLAAGAGSTSMILEYAARGGKLHERLLPTAP